MTCASILYFKLLLMSAPRWIDVVTPLGGVQQCLTANCYICTSVALQDLRTGFVAFQMSVPWHLEEKVGDWQLWERYSGFELAWPLSKNEKSFEVRCLPCDSHAMVFWLCTMVRDIWRCDGNFRVSSISSQACTLLASQNQNYESNKSFSPPLNPTCIRLNRWAFHWIHSTY